MSPKTRAGAGKAVVILRDTGQVLAHATILEPSFQVQTPDLGTLTLKAEHVQSIVYRNLPTFPTDALRTIGGSELNGVVLNDPVHISAEELGGQAALAKAKIISIVF
jgi:hypothetical protein